MVDGISVMVMVVWPGCDGVRTNDRIRLYELPLYWNGYWTMSTMALELGLITRLAMRVDCVEIAVAVVAGKVVYSSLFRQARSFTFWTFTGISLLLDRFSLFQ